MTKMLSALIFFSSNLSAQMTFNWFSKLAHTYALVRGFFYKFAHNHNAFGASGGHVVSTKVIHSHLLGFESCRRR